MALELMRGNEAIAEGAIRAGCRFYAGYPITPQNELFEYMAKRLPQAGGIFLQCESEVAGINMIWGAACTGTRAMTSSSGPGISLMSEGLTTLAAGQLPCVVVDVTRAGPGLGRIAPAQSDYRQVTKGGGHGDYRAIVLGPASTQEMAELVALAFHLGDLYRNPVIILMDGMLGQMMEPVDFDLVKPLPVPDKPWALRGKGDGPRKMIYAAPFDDPGLIQLNQELTEKYRQIEEREQRWEEILLDGAKLVVMAFGSAARVALDAVQVARAEGLPVGMIRPITLWPFPQKGLAKLRQTAKAFLDVEMNAGQMQEDLERVVGPDFPIYHLGQGGGKIIYPDEVYEEITRLFQIADCGLRI
ncbi:MAG: 3-methyl-2-oxobutanoate dehydrogenase subunit VorB [Deltaproteobacteria bacterium]|jgi:2-oxoglutarate ferredoxin oxidoreductase subunit alpha|nr:3-methyl-2-oxobutanoate dehydrogenase subunit VorB [Deltaproteobacteria bacterium]